MIIKCGHCGNSIDTGKDKKKTIDKAHIGFICPFCDRVNKVPLQRLAPPSVQAPTKVIEVLRQPSGNAVPGLVPGWIFVHDENTPMQSFDLREGKNIIGRKSAVAADIAIETTDAYMSRRHCVVEVKRNESGQYRFLLSDNKALNGTFINGASKMRLKPEDIVILNDGDTLQLGMTKVVIRINDRSSGKEQVQQQVKDSSYTRTVLISK